jgi:hypothetical protein
LYSARIALAAASSEARARRILVFMLNANVEVAALTVVSSAGGNRASHRPTTAGIATYRALR